MVVMMRSGLLVCGHPRRAGVGWVVALLLFLFNDHCVLSIPTNIDHRSGSLSEDHRNLASTVDQIQTEIKELNREINKQKMFFRKRFTTLNTAIKQDLTAAKAIFLGCNPTNGVCMSWGTKKLMKVHNKLQKKVKFIKGNREKILSKLQKSVDTKNQQLNDLLNRPPTDKTDTDNSLYQLKENDHAMDADCKIYGLTDEALPEHAHEWNELIDVFQAIVNLGYVDTGSDRIYLVDDKDLPNRNLKLRPRLRFNRLTSGTCRACNRKRIKPAPGMNGHKRPPEGPPEESSAFVKFVNEYMSRVVTGIVPPDHVVQEIKVSCKFFYKGEL